MSNLAQDLFAAVALASDEPLVPVRVIVPDVRQAVLLLTSISHTGVSSLGTDARCDVWSDLNTWRLELIAAPPAQLRDRLDHLKQRTAVCLPVMA